MALKAIRDIYPLHLVLLAFTPILTGFLIDPELSDSWNIIINLIWIPLFTIPYIIFQKKWIFQLATSIYFLMGFIEIGHWIILKGPLTLTSLLVISNTNFQEAKEFFHVTATIELIVLIPYSYLYYYSLRHPPHLLYSRIRPYFIGFVLLVAASFIGENAINGRLIRNGTPQIVKVIFSFLTQRNLYKEAMLEMAPRQVNATSAFSEERQTFVLILGESCSRRHMSLYGAQRKTNPKLEMRKDLIVYDNVVSPYSNTINAVLMMFSNSNLEQRLSFDNCIDLMDVFHSAGFKTYWISNQSPIGIWDNLVTVLAKKSDDFKFVNTSSNSSIEASHASSYDYRLFKPFSSALTENIPKKFIVLHLMGSHTFYSKRYPDEFDIFKGTNRKEKTIATYDNSILYNDYIVDSLINITASNDSQKRNNIISVIYLSDHGENVFDTLDRIGHSYSNELPGVNVEVPFIVWLSPSYIESNEDKAKIIRSNYYKPFVTDDLFHSIMDLNGIQSPYLEKERSIFNEKFNEARPRILEDGKVYDIE
jgi:heptose-I-phosphate ethanolaminephosphotransferase